MRKNRVLVVGSANMDLVVFTESFPKPGETVFGNKFNMFPGGKGANQAVSCSRLGSKTYFIAKFGKDEFADSLITSMGKDNVDLSYIRNDNNSSTGTALITVDNKGENEIVVISGANMELSPRDLEKSKNLFFEVGVVLTQLEIPLATVEKAAEFASQTDSIFILNPAPARQLGAEIMKRVDILTPNEIELGILTNTKIQQDSDVVNGAKLLLNQGVKNVIVTLGEKGSILVNNNVVKHFPTIEVHAVDSTAAGDTFNGCLASCLSKGMSIEESIGMSNIAAALSVTKKGAQSSMPTDEELNRVEKTN